MANKVTVEIQGKENLSTATHSAGRGLKGLTDQIGSTVKAFLTFEAIKQVAQIVGECTKAWAEQEKALITYQAAMRPLESLYAGATERLRDYAESIARITGEDDEAVLSMESFLASVGRSETGIRSIIDAAIGLSVATGQDLRSAVEQINITFSGTTRGLARLVPSIKDLTKEELAAGKGVELIQKQFGDLNGVLAGSADVAIKNMANAWEDFGASIGQMFSTVFNPLLTWLTGLINGINDLNNKARGIVDIYNKAKMQGVSKLNLDEQEKYYRSLIEVANTAIKQESTGFGNVAKVKEYYDLIAGFERKIGEIAETRKYIAMEGMGQGMSSIAAPLREGGAATEEKHAYDVAYDELIKLIDAYKKTATQAYYFGETVDEAAKRQEEFGKKEFEFLSEFGADLGKVGNAKLREFWAELDRSTSALIKNTEQQTQEAISGAGVEGGIWSEDVSGNIPNPAAAIDFTWLTDLFAEISPMIESISSIAKLMSPVMTIIQAALDVLAPAINTLLAPLVGILQIFGQLIGKVVVPVLNILWPVIKLVADAFVWLYNYVLRPVGNLIILIGNVMYNAVAWVYNQVAWLWGGSLAYRNLNEGQLGEITNADVTTAGTTGGTTGTQAQYETARPIIVNVTISEATLVGTDGVRQFALMIGNELRAAGVLGL